LTELKFITAGATLLALTPAYGLGWIEDERIAYIMIKNLCRRKHLDTGSVHYYSMRR